MRHRIAASLSTIAAVLLVLGAYAFYASAGTFEFRRVSWDTSLYNSLAEGFLNGTLSLAHQPEPALLRLDDPYDINQRGDIPLQWDASLYNKKLYLYFSPVPLLLFTIPFRLVSGGYPADALAAAFFCSWAFLASCAFVRRALASVPRDSVDGVPRSSSGSSESLGLDGVGAAIPPRNSEELRGTRGTALWLLLIGLGHIVPFVLLDVRVYEVAIACGMAMSATWAYTLLRFLERPSTRSAALMGVFLALAIATRPNLIVLIVVVAAAILTLRERRRIIAAAIAAAIPVIVVGSAYAIYNYARFGSPAETGLTYQLTVMPMRGETPCRLCNRGDVARFFNTAMHYIFLPPKFVSTFPFVDLKWNDVEPQVSFPAMPEQVGGFAPITPIALAGSGFAALLLLARRIHDDGLRAAMLLMAAAWIVLLTLSTCRWVTARYSLDFYILLLLGTAIVVERGVAFLADAGVAIRPLRIFVATLAIYSIVVGLLLGFAGPRQSFLKLNPQLFGKIARTLT